MHRFKQHLKIAFKIAAVSTVTGSVLGFGYLQYINSQLGPINLSYEKATTYYRDKYQMSDSKAIAIYYFSLWNLSITRIFGYQNYISYCDNLNRKIINYSLQNYENAHIFEEIDKAGPISSNKAAHQKIYQKIEAIRKTNAQNVEDREYVIKGIFNYQKEFNSSQLPNIPS